MSDVESSVRCDFLVEELDEHLLVRAIGELDECSASALIALADDLSNRSRRMVIDLAGVTLLGSAGVYGLMNLRDRLIELTLLNPSPAVRAVLKASGLEGLADHGACAVADCSSLPAPAGPLQAGHGGQLTSPKKGMVANPNPD